MSRHPLYTGSENTDLPGEPSGNLADESLRAYAEARADRSRAERARSLDQHAGAQPVSAEGPATPPAPEAAEPAPGWSNRAIVAPPPRDVVHSDPRGAGADRFRLLRMRLRNIRSTANLKAIVITSPLPSDGKTTVALNLAAALKEPSKQTVLLIDADMHRSPLDALLDLETGPGLAECLADNQDPFALVKRIDPLGWCLLPAGRPPKNATALLQSPRLAEVIHTLMPHFDWVLIDSPPVISITDALLLAKQADSTLLVVRENETPAEAVSESLDLLGREHVAGIVFNGAHKLGRRYSRYGYYYRS